MVWEHMQRGRQEIKIFLKTLVQDLPSMISSRTQASCLPGFLFYGATLTPAPSPPTDRVELLCVCHSSCCSSGCMVFFLKGLHSCDGEGTPAAQTAEERSCSHFPICIPRRFCLVQVSWGSEGCNPSRAQTAGCCSASGRKWAKRWPPEQKSAGEAICQIVTAPVKHPEFPTR